MPTFPEPTAAVTLYDVARLADVSPSTVSRILNGTAKVTAAKRAAVEQAIAQLNFKPNLWARSLRSGSTKTVGILAKDVDSLFFSLAVRGVDDGLVGTGFAPIIVLGHGEPGEEADRIRLLMARRVDAIVLVGTNLPDSRIEEFARAVPVAVLARSCDADRVLSFEFDQAMGGRIGTQHLIDLGHRAIAHIAGPLDQADARGRQDGYLQALANAQIASTQHLIVEGNFSIEGGSQAMEALLDAGHHFTAVFCANDMSAWGACLALLRRGLRIPEDVSVVGFDDFVPSEIMGQPLTTVRQPIYEMSRCIAASLLHVLGQNQQPVTNLPSLSLVVRSSTARLKD